MTNWPPSAQELEVLRPRFDAKVQRGHDDACWPWTGATVHGYGVLKLRSRGGPRRAFKAHRLALLFAGRPIGGSELALHSCDNPPCCNPMRLRPGTRRDNVQDATDRKRWNDRRGELNVRARLTAEQVGSVRAMLSNGVSQGDLAWLFDVAQTTISAIKRGENWSHL